MHAQTTKLSSSITVARYLELEQAEDRETIGRFIRLRFEERYFKPLENSQSKNGFAMLAVACLVIETLEAFYQGQVDTKQMSKKMFSDFFKRDTALKIFSSPSDWFYFDIRCGILHQGETCAGWRIWRKGALLDMENKTINATKFLQELRESVERYGSQLSYDDKCWENFKKKMAAVCKNCDES